MQRRVRLRVGLEPDRLEPKELAQPEEEGVVLRSKKKVFNKVGAKYLTDKKDLAPRR